MASGWADECLRNITKRILFQVETEWKPNESPLHIFFLDLLIRSVPDYYLFFSYVREPVRRPGQYVKPISPTAFNLVPSIEQKMLKTVCELLV